MSKKPVYDRSLYNAPEGVFYIPSNEDRKGADKVASTKSQFLGYMREADPRISHSVAKAEVGAPDGRSPWFWIRLNNGDLMLACFPFGEMYETAEADPKCP